MTNDPKKHYSELYHLQMASTPENYWLYGYIRCLGVRSVFEFGCNAGRHLHQLARMGLEVSGIDINTRALEAAELIHGLTTLHVGDEKSLQQIPDGAYDLVMTVSVLNHIEEVKPVIQELRRIARQHLILAETRSRTDSGNYWWQHDYPGESVYNYYAKQVNAVYQIWHTEK